MTRRIVPEIKRKPVVKNLVSRKKNRGNSNFIIPKLLPIGARLVCADTSGAKELKIIGYKKKQSTRKRLLTGGVGDICVVTVTKGVKTLRKQWHYALIIRQKVPITRKTGTLIGKVCFRDNAAVLLDKEKKSTGFTFKIKKCTVKGPIAREVHQINQKFEGITGEIR